MGFMTEVVLLQTEAFLFYVLLISLVLGMESLAQVL